VSEERVKLTTYFGERDRVDGRTLADELLAICERHRISEAILFRGAEGFGRLHHVHTDRLLSLSEDLPVVATALARREQVDALLADVLSAQRRGLVSLERTRLLVPGTTAIDIGDGSGDLGGDGDARKLTVHVGRGERVGGGPAFVAVCELLRERGISGASVLLGVDGLRDGRRTRARLLSRNAGVPISIVVVGERELITAVVPSLTTMLRRPLVTLERVRICKRDGELLQRPHMLAGSDARGLALWQKLTVYSSHDATHERRSLHLELVRRLRAGDAAGATCLNGVWGFHGAHPPHGERLLPVRRHMPVLTITIDSPANAQRSFELIDELTAEHGLVTSEVVPAVHAVGDGRAIGQLELADPHEP
jgi:PII-like signaling protein